MQTTQRRSASPIRSRKFGSSGSSRPFTRSRNERVERSTRNDRSERGERSNHSDRNDRGERNSRNDRPSGSRSGGFRDSRSGGFSRRGPMRGRAPRKRSVFDVAQYINKNPVATTPEAPQVVTNTFDDFGISESLMRAVHDMGFTSPTAIQDTVIPHILSGDDIIGLSNTGTGKTAAFLIPLIEKTIRNADTQTLILAPTRELAIQIQDELRKLTTHARMYSTVCVGGANIRPQITSLKRKNHFIIGTPGRVIDLIERGKLLTDRITTVVLDEADRMLDMGFIHDMRNILSNVREDRHTLFFSATMSKEIEALVSDFLRNPVTISHRKREVTNDIAQDVIRCSEHEKFDTLVSLLLDAETYDRVLIFGAMKHSVEKLARDLSKAGIKSESIHGNKSHGQRQVALKRFKSGDVRVLVATDVAARGIHIDDVSHVINFDLPSCHEDYVHRIGRTGRAGKRGQALTFVPHSIR